MKRVGGIACLAFILASVPLTAVPAADLGYGPNSPQDVLIAAPVPIWSGVYAGATAGYAAGDNDAGEINGPRAYRSDFDGAMFTMHAGWQTQVGRVVGGVEVEAGHLGLDSTVTRDVTGGSITSGAALGAYAAISGRLGYLIHPSLLIYGRAGITIAEIDGGTTQTCADATLCGGAQSTAVSEAKLDSSAWGLLLGAGLERQLSTHWLMRLEYKFMDFSDQLALPTVDGPGWEHDIDVHAVHAGFSYRF